MRPAITIPRLDAYRGAIPVGWIWQIKLNDERATVAHDGTLMNRFERPISANKEKAFGDALASALRMFDRPLDLALLGFRGQFPIGGIVVLDLPGPGGFLERTRPLEVLPILCIGQVPVSGTVYRLQNFVDPFPLFERTIGVVGLEGVIGRRPGAGYCEGNSRDMCKSKWKT